MTRYTVGAGEAIRLANEYMAANKVTNASLSQAFINDLPSQVRTWLAGKLATALAELRDQEHRSGPGVQAARAAFEKSQEAVSRSPAVAQAIVWLLTGQDEAPISALSGDPLAERVAGMDGEQYATARGDLGITSSEWIGGSEERPRFSRIYGNPQEHVTKRGIGIGKRFERDDSGGWL